MYFYKKNRFGPLCLFLAAIISLTGCNTASHDTVQEQDVPETLRQAVDWNNHQMSAARDAVEGTQWNLREYYESWITYPETYDWKHSEFFQSPDGDFCARTQYVAYDDDGKVSDAWFSLDYFDMETKNSFHADVDDEWGVPKGAYLRLVDVAGDKLVACHFVSTESIGTPRSYYSLVFYHMEDGVQKTLDLLPALTDAGMVDSLEFEAEKNVLCDPNGCCYIVLEDRIIIVSDTGQLLLVAEPEEDTAPLTYLCKTPEGFPVFASANFMGSNSYWIYDQTAGEMHSLGKSGYMPLDNGYYCCMDCYGSIYYFLMCKINRWDTLTGDQESIFDCIANSICGNSMAQKLLAIRENGDLAILDPLTDQKGIYVLSPTTPDNARTLTLVSTAYESQLEQTAAALFSMKNLGVNIEYTAISDGESNLINRIVAGDVPDMFIISSETMNILYEKGVLADLSDAIPDELRAQVFDCVWNVGTIDGKLIGLTTNPFCRGMLVSDDVWSGDTWTLEDMLELAEHAPENTLKGLIPMQMNIYDSSCLLLELALRDISPSLVDRETGTCHFDSENFRKLLEYCKNTPALDENYSWQSPATAQSVANGEYLAYADGNVGDLFSFSEQMSYFPENFHWVGVPTERESGNLVNAHDFLVVNKNSENMDLIMEFLPTLYGEEISRRYPFSCLRRDVLRSRVFIPDWDPHPYFNKGESIYMPLLTKSDGTSYVEEYIAFMDSCIPFPYGDDVIASIVLEEVEPYFAGDKDMDTVIGIIQSRVQTYLDENGS